MATIRDMLESEVMPEPQWPRCAKCHVDLVERIDPRTGKPTTDRGRALMQCPQCGDISIKPSPAGQRRRYRLIHGIMLVSGFFAIAATLIGRYVRYRGTGLSADSISDLRILVPLIMAVGCAVTLHLLLDSVARALSPGKADVRFTWGAYAVFWCAALGLFVFVSFATLPKLISAVPPPTTRGRNPGPPVPNP